MIGIVPDQIVTRAEIRTIEPRDGRWIFDGRQDIALIACIERHKATGQRGLGLVSGFGFRVAGAFGSLLSLSEEYEKLGRFAEASELCQKAAALAPLSAEAQYRLGTALSHSTNQAAALAHLQAACDLDTLPFRADSRINGIIRRAATGAANPGLRLFDAAVWLATNAPGGLLGQEPARGRGVAVALAAGPGELAAGNDPGLGAGHDMGAVTIAPGLR